MSNPTPRRALKARAHPEDTYAQPAERIQPQTLEDRQQQLSIGYGMSTAHYGELFQGEIEDSDRRRRRCLLSLPCGPLYSKAAFCPQQESKVAVFPIHKMKAKKTVELVLEFIGAVDMGGILRISSNIDEAKGYGSSTADCVAAAIAVGDALERPLGKHDIARLVVQAETASDSVMFDHAVLFAQREGVVVEDYAMPVPPFEVAGFDTDGNRRVDTLLYPPAAYSWREVCLFHTLTVALRRAIRTQDAELLGRVATASSVINERFLPKPFFAEIRQLADEFKALGVAVAHSGTTAAIMFDIHAPGLDQRMDVLRERLTALGATNFRRFRSPSTPDSARAHD